MSIEQSPIVRLTDDIELTWLNTCIRLFRDNSFNHVEYYEDDDVKGLRVGQVVMDILFEHDYPYRYDPIVDDATMEWYIKSEVTLLDDELDEL